MLVNIVLIVVTVISTVKNVSYGIWAVKNRNISGGAAVITAAAAVLFLTAVYLINEYNI